MDGPKLLCRGHCLEHSGSVFSALNKSLYFKGTLAPLAICHPTHALQWAVFLCTQSAVPPKGSVARAQSWASWWPLGIRALWSRTRKTMTTASGSCRQTQMSFHLSWLSQGLFMVIHALASHCPSHRLISLEQPKCQVKRLMARAHEWLPAKLLWVQPNLLQFIPSLEASSGETLCVLLGAVALEGNIPFSCLCHSA